MLEELIVKKALFILLAVIMAVFSSCATSGEGKMSSDDEFANEINSVFEQYSNLGEQVFYGFSGPYTSKEKGIMAATENAYMMALLYEDLAMKVDVSIDVDTARNRDSFKTYTDALYDQSRLSEIASRLEIIDIKWLGGDIGAAVVATYINPASSRPDSDYVYDSGTIFRYFYVQDSMFAAAYSAAVNLALNNPELSAVVSNTELDNDEMTEQSYQIHLSRLDGFEILSYSYNPETKEYTCTARALKH